MTLDVIVAHDDVGRRWVVAAVVEGAEAVHGAANNAARADVRAAVVIGAGDNGNPVATAAATNAAARLANAHASAAFATVLSIGSANANPVATAAAAKAAACLANAHARAAFTHVLTIGIDRLAPEGATRLEVLFDGLSTLLPNDRVS